MHTNKSYNKGSILLLSHSPFQKMLLAIAQSSNLGAVFDTLLSPASPTLSSTHLKIPNMTLHFHCFATTPGYHCLFPNVDCTSPLAWIPLLLSFVIHSSNVNRSVFLKT